MIINIKNKLVNNFFKNGKKNFSENYFLLKFKNMNKFYLKKIKFFFQVVLNFSSYLFKYQKNKKNNFFIFFKTRIFLAIKNSLFFIEKDFLNENLYFSQKKIQNELLLNKKLLLFFRWHKFNDKMWIDSKNN